MPRKGSPRRVYQGKGDKEWLPSKRVPRMGVKERLPRKGWQGRAPFTVSIQMAAKQKGAKERASRRICQWCKGMAAKERMLRNGCHAKGCQGKGTKVSLSRKGFQGMAAKQKGAKERASRRVCKGKGGIV
jgi:hypothetical protein